jgi:hypothetical protein
MTIYLVVVPEAQSEEYLLEARSRSCAVGLRSTKKEEEKNITIEAVSNPITRRLGFTRAAAAPFLKNRKNTIPIFKRPSTKLADLA